MRTSYAVGLVVVTLLAIVCGTLIRGQASPAIPAVTIPGVPTTGSCCLWRIHKKAGGDRRVTWQVPYATDKGPTARGSTVIRLTLTSEGPPCDENPGLVPNNSVLQVRGYTLRRADSFAHLIGTFTLSNPAGAVLFSGTLEAMDRIGTHHAPFGGEQCDQQGHLEGWLVGKGAGPMAPFTLRALVVGRASLPTGTAGAPIAASIDGTLIKSP